MIRSIELGDQHPADHSERHDGGIQQQDIESDEKCGPFQSPGVLRGKKTCDQGGLADVRQGPDAKERDGRRQRKELVRPRASHQVRRQRHEAVVYRGQTACLTEGEECRDQNARQHDQGLKTVGPRNRSEAAIGRVQSDGDGKAQRSPNIRDARHRLHQAGAGYVLSDHEGGVEDDDDDAGNDADRVALEAVPQEIGEGQGAGLPAQLRNSLADDPKADGRDDHQRGNPQQQDPTVTMGERRRADEGPAAG